MTSDPTPKLTDRRYVGRICKHHLNSGGVRYKCNYRCVDCVRARTDLYQALHPKRVAVNKRRYDKKHRNILNALRRRIRKEKLRAETLNALDRAIQPSLPVLQPGTEVDGREG